MCLRHVVSTAIAADAVAAADATAAAAAIDATAATCILPMGIVQTTDASYV